VTTEIVDQPGFRYFCFAGAFRLPPPARRSVSSWRAYDKIFFFIAMQHNIFRIAQ